jgi:hypothetical protein
MTAFGPPDFISKAQLSEGPFLVLTACPFCGTRDLSPMAMVPINIGRQAALGLRCGNKECPSKRVMFAVVLLEGSSDATDPVT